MSERILTVILNYRTADMTLRAAQAACRAMQGLSGEITVVDNASGDGSYERLRDGIAGADWARGQTIRVLQSGRNGGFGAGNNVGIRAGLSDGQRPDYVFILNSDAFPDADAIRVLRDYLNTHPRAGFAGSYIQGDTGEPHVSAFRFPNILGEFENAARTGPVTRLLKNHIIHFGVPEATQRVDWLAGAAMMMRQDVLDDIGLFDETFFLYFEETDLSLRAKRAGYETHYVRDSRVIHIGGVSTGMKAWKRLPGYWLDSRWHYYTKNHGRAFALAATAARGLGWLLWQTRRSLARRPDDLPKNYMRDLLAHHTRALFRPLPRPRAKLPDTTRVNVEVE